MKFKKLISFENALDYVNRVGAIPIDRKSPGWIPHWQKEACDLINKLEKAYGFTYPFKNHPYYDTPMMVHYQRPTKDDYHGYMICKLPDNSKVKIPTW